MTRWTFSAGEVILVALFSLLLGRAIVPQGDHARRPIWSVDPVWERQLTARYGAERFSAGLEEYLIQEHFRGERHGVFVDVGAFEAVQGSNTYRLERDFGWSGLAVDADVSVAPGYEARPLTTFVAAFVGEADEGTATLYKDSVRAGTSSGNRAFTEQFGSVAAELLVPNRTLNGLLAEHGIVTIDYLSMDIELGEPAALRGFSIERYRPRLVSVEAHRPTRQWLLDYFARNGYVLVADFLQADPLNLWFVPLQNDTPDRR